MYNWTVRGMECTSLLSTGQYTYVQCVTCTLSTGQSVSQHVNCYLLTSTGTYQYMYVSQYVNCMSSTGWTINRKLERLLGLERLSSARAGFLIDELGQEPQS